jgi:hypothetical protein
MHKVVKTVSSTVGKRAHFGQLVTSRSYRSWSALLERAKERASDGISSAQEPAKVRSYTEDLARLNRMEECVAIVDRCISSLRSGERSVTSEEYKHDMTMAASQFASIIGTIAGLGLTVVSANPLFLLLGFPAAWVSMAAVSMTDSNSAYREGVRAVEECRYALSYVELPLEKNWIAKYLDDAREELEKLNKTI